MAKLWLKNGKIVTDSSGRPILCDTCPCDTECPEGSGLYKIVALPWVDEAWAEEGSCSCVCLIEGAIPDPRPEGHEIGRYVKDYDNPIIVEGVSKTELLGGPYAAVVGDPAASPPTEDKTAMEVCAETPHEKCQCFPSLDCVGDYKLSGYKRTSHLPCARNPLFEAEFTQNGDSTIATLGGTSASGCSLCFGVPCAVREKWDVEWRDGEDQTITVCVSKMGAWGTEPVGSDSGPSGCPDGSYRHSLDALLEDGSQSNTEKVSFEIAKA